MDTVLRMKPGFQKALCPDQCQQNIGRNGDGIGNIKEHRHGFVVECLSPVPVAVSIGLKGVVGCVPGISQNMAFDSTSC